jgi:MFS family permease
MSVAHDQPERLDLPTSSVPSFVERHYTTYLICVALAGWSLASYDFNLLVLTFPDIAKSLHLAPAAIGLLGFIIYASMFIITFLAGYGMDQYGRKWMWMFCLTSAAIFTGLTYFVQNYWQLAVVRALASGFANSELAISITLVNEQVPSHRRGLLYSIVQGGWPVGVFLASGVFLLFNRFGWRTVFLFGVIPIICVIFGRFWVKESDRFQHVRAVREAASANDNRRVQQLSYSAITSMSQKSRRSPSGNCSAPPAWSAAASSSSPSSGCSMPPPGSPRTST